MIIEITHSSYCGLKTLRCQDLCHVYFRTSSVGILAVICSGHHRKKIGQTKRRCDAYQDSLALTHSQMHVEEAQDQHYLLTSITCCPSDFAFFLTLENLVRHSAFSLFLDPRWYSNWYFAHAPEFKEMIIIMQTLLILNFLTKTKVQAEYLGKMLGNGDAFRR